MSAQPQPPPPPPPRFEAPQTEMSPYTQSPPRQEATALTQADFSLPPPAAQQQQQLGQGTGGGRGGVRVAYRALLMETVVPPADAPEALAAEEGEVVSVRYALEGGVEPMVFAENLESGETGVLPRRVISLGVPLLSLAVFAPQDMDEVPLSEGEVVFGFRIDDGEWWYGVSQARGRHRIGYFPCNWVRQMDEAEPLSVQTAAGSLGNLPPVPGGSRMQPRKMGPIAGKSQQQRVSGGVQARPESAIGLSAPAEYPYAGAVFEGRPGATLAWALLAHNMAYFSAIIVFTCGIFAISWTSSEPWNCEVDGQLIANKYILEGTTDDGTCTAGYCCEREDDPDTIDVGGDASTGALYVVGAFVIPLAENAEWGFGLWRPSNSWRYEHGFPAAAIAYFAAALPGFTNYATLTAAGFLIATAFANLVATYKGECGDGGRLERWVQRQRGGSKHCLDEIIPHFKFMTPLEWYRKLRDEDRLSVYVWLVLYGVASITMFFSILNEWYGIVDKQRNGLLDGDLDIKCGSLVCKDNKNVIEHGPLSEAAAWAKAAGGSLNFHCSLILLPVIRLILRNINNVGETVSVSKAAEASCVAAIFARPINRYIPLQKNVEFHKLVAFVVFVLAYVHTLAHFINMDRASEYTLVRFEKWGWGGTSIFTGAVILFAMLFIYCGAFQRVRHASYELFFATHHWFTVFFAFLLIHGPVFVFWALLPIALYLFERYLQRYRGNRVWLVNKVEWIPPVLALYFRPQRKGDFNFKEGQYCYLNVPFVSKREWHPFTISSAVDDLRSGPRVAVETGEEVVAVPRPKDLAPTTKWNKYCPVSVDWRSMRPQDFLEKHETAYMDYVSLHIKVFGLNDPVPRTWTRRVKDYFELLNPGDKFPFYFSTRDKRGELRVGRRTGPSGEPMIRVDGPHAAPSMHYTAYGTVMVIGAGIGMTPCASILTAMLRYRWKKNFNPEILQFYWIVRANEVDAFQWFVHLLTDLEFEAKRLREAGQIEAQNYCQINIYVTGTARQSTAAVRPLKRPPKVYSTAFTEPEFKANDLYALLKHPPVPSKHQIEAQTDPNAPNRLQDIFVWAGRPMWDSIFSDARDRRVHPDIGVCFCGAPVIGRDLGNMCEKYSSVEQQVLFSLHKENF